MQRSISPLIGLLLLASVPLQAAVNDDTGRSDVARVHIPQDGLTNPFFTSRAFPIFEKEIILSYSNPNEGSETEIYISRSPDSDFELAATNPAGAEVFEDTSRLPRTTYYFKLRAIKGDLTSDFSEVKSFTTGSKFYPPFLDAQAKGPGTIELKFHDRSYNDLYYVLWRDGPGPDFNPTIVATDSGQVFTITDDFLEPNTMYYYRVDAYTKGPNMPRYINIVNATVTTPEGPMIFAFTIVDADTDEDVTGLYEGIAITPPDHPNIKAEASDGTESVVFFLNGKKRIENEAPYSYFYDSNGDYRAGRLDPGDYELIATPYSGNNAQGTQGASLKINFTVTVPAGGLAIESFTLVDPNTGQDIQELQDGDVVDPTSRPNIRANAGDETGSVLFHLNGIRRVENEAPYAYFYDAAGVYRPGRLREGSYTLEATAYSGNNGTGEQGTTVTIEFTVTASLSGARAASVSLYPNPVVSASQVEIAGSPHSNVRIEITDQYGWQRSRIHEGFLNSEGKLIMPLDFHALPSGNYMMLIHIEDAETIKRFMIE
ncbi:MAG: hypothetical protein WA874_16485 [Chryseosolibacter sp.]